MNTNLILLSSKSAGSTVLQKYLISQYSFSTVGWTRHHEKETLFWTKVASILDLPQEKMLRSAVPYEKDQARNSISEFLARNNISVPQKESRQGYLEVYAELIKKFGPRFIEKSPHHLYNRSNLELLLEAKRSISTGDRVQIMGLIRNPLDTLYSTWNRWKYDPVSYEKEWLQSYANLKRLVEEEGIYVLRYEDLVQSPRVLDEHLEKWLGTKSSTTPFEFYSSSVLAWRRDQKFAHQIGKDTIDLAIYFGYAEEDLLNVNKHWKWPLQKLYFRTRYNLASLRR